MLDKVYKRHENVVLRDIVQEIILFPLKQRGETDFLYNINDTAKFIWDQLDGQKNLAQIAAAVQKEFQVDAQRAEADIVLFIQKLENERIVQQV